ncbi:MAG: hypothetical protein JOZ41_04050 [Chloroflexi bacterium]|nr:hypothetical protein [Chloroflexota bacterium]
MVAFVQFWYDFIIGDDWIVAAAVVGSLIVIFVAKANVWWLLPVVVILVLGASLWRVAQSER